MTCEACCREFEARGRIKDCPYCGYNNGPGWWPRSDDPAGVAAGMEERKRFLAMLRRGRKAGTVCPGAAGVQDPGQAEAKVVA